MITAFTARYSPTAGLLSDFVVGAHGRNPRPAPAGYTGDQEWTDRLWNLHGSNPYGDTCYGETLKMLVSLVMAGDYRAPAG